MDLNPHYKEVALDLAKQAGEIMLRHFQRGIEVTTKDNDTPLTIADTAINNLVVETIHREFPTHGLIAEEGGTDYADQEFAWVCDPIDGTINFARNIPCSVFSLALVHDGEPILGIVNDPYMRYLYIGEKHKGTTLNGEPIHVSTKESGSMVGLNSFRSEKVKMRRLFPMLLDRGMESMFIHSAVYMGMLVGRGDLDGLVFPGVSPWDTAAQKVIIEEAGGKVTNLRGDNQRYDRETGGIIASNGLLHDRLVALVQESGALDG